MHLHPERVKSICCGASCHPSPAHRGVWRCPRRLPRDPPAADDRPTEVPPGEGGGAAGMLPAAERHPGGAIQERCGKEHGFPTVLIDFIALRCLNRSYFTALIIY